MAYWPCNRRHDVTATTVDRQRDGLSKSPFYHSTQPPTNPDLSQVEGVKGNPKRWLWLAGNRRSDTLIVQSSPILEPEKNGPPRKA